MLSETKIYFSYTSQRIIFVTNPPMLRNKTHFIEFVYANLWVVTLTHLPAIYFFKKFIQIHHKVKVMGNKTIKF